MDRAVDAREIAPDRYLKKIYGLSTDTKETANIANGSLFIEMDTGDAYFFDEENTRWLKVDGSNIPYKLNQNGSDLL